jgi:molybdenum cofactor sulfurtransferase
MLSTRAQEEEEEEFFAKLRAREFSRLDRLDQVYLDYTGSGLYAESQIRSYFELLQKHVWGNPHSTNPTSLESTKQIKAIKERIRTFFDAEEYEIIFTLNATNALKLVGESYPFNDKCSFVLTADNHNSVNGIREFAKAKGAQVRYVPLNSELRVDSIEPYFDHRRGSSNLGLFAYPAQSNFSGVKHPLSWIKKAHDFGYDVLLDAAAYVPTNRLSLSDCEPDFVPISFYKIFGFPTGVGALLAKRDALKKLRRPWFSGGTIKYVSTTGMTHLLNDGADAHEDGTVNFLGILALGAGFDIIESVGIDKINKNVRELTELLLKRLQELSHSNGRPLVKIYGPKSMESRGGTVTFNLLDEDGKEIDASKVAELTTANKISVRTGCFCNPGAAEFAFNYDPVRASKCFESIPHEEFTLQQFSTCMDGKPVGAVRASLGIASNEGDIDRLILVLDQFRDAKHSKKGKDLLASEALKINRYDSV